MLNNKIPTITKQIGQKLYRTVYETIFKVYLRISDHTNAITCGRKLLAICRECGDTVKEGNLGMVLAEVYYTQTMYAEAKELYERTNIIMRKIGDREGEAACNANLGAVFKSLGRYLKAKEFLQKAHAISLEVSDRQGAAICYLNLGTVFESLGEHVQAKEYLHKALTMTMETGDRAVEASSYVLYHRLLLRHRVCNAHVHGATRGLKNVVFSLCSKLITFSFVHSNGSISLVVTFGDEDGIQCYFVYFLGYLYTA